MATRAGASWVLDEAAASPFIREAWEAGINFFDTADMYSLGASETILGRALKELAPRDEVVIATKVFNPMGKRPTQKGLSRKHVMEGIDASLKRLGTEYVDLLIIHRFDPDTPIEETVEALSDVVKAGKALYLGASSMWAWQFMKMLGIQRANALAPFVSMQNYLNLVYREEEREMLPLCRAEGIAVTPWSPLARGFLAGSKGAATVRARTDTYQDALGLGAEQDLAILDRVAGGGAAAGSQAGAGGAGLGARDARCQLADRRRLQAPSPRRCTGRARADPGRRDASLSGGALSTAAGIGASVNELARLTLQIAESRFGIR